MKTTALRLLHISAFCVLLFALIVIPSRPVCSQPLSDEQAKVTGNIEGLIVDAIGGTPMIGVSVRLQNTQLGAATDLDGHYRIRNIPVGNYTLLASYVGYAPLSITDVAIEGGDTKTLNFKMTEEAIEVGEVVIEARMINNSEAALLTLQKKAASISDGISAEQIKKSPDSDAADAVKRVTGVTVVGGKFVYVRGMGERYNNTRLNGAFISSPEPKRRVVPFDIVPAGLLDNVIVSKTFTPDMPGDFAGGAIEINTKEFPEKLTFNMSNSVTYNTETTFKDFKTYRGGNTDWLGIDDGTRALPDRVEAETTDREWKSDTKLRRELAKEFTDTWQPQTMTAPLGTSQSISLGNQTMLFGKPLGYLGALTYSKSYSRTHSHECAYSPGAVLQKQADLDYDKSVRSISWGGVFDLNLKASPEHKFSLKNMYTRSADDETRTMTGIIDTDGPYMNHRLQWTERSILSVQPRGSHYFPGLGDSRFDWRYAYSHSTFNEPDRRDVYYFWQEEREIYTWLNTNVGSFRRFAEMDDNTSEFALDWSFPLKKFGGDSKLKAGGLYRTMDREFPTRKFYYDLNREIGAPATPDSLPPDVLLADQFIDSYFVLNEITRPTDPYEASMKVGAVYLMADVLIHPKWRLIGGVRVEDTDQYFKTFTLEGQEDGIREEGGPKHTDLLPSASIVYVANENTNVRLAASRTIINPDYSELVPTEDQVYFEGAVLRGNSSLDYSKVLNVDFRVERYPGIGESIIVGVFYKRVNDPIEWFYTTGITATELISPNNLGDSDNIGFEIEARKQLGFLSNSAGPWIRFFSISGNLALIKSTVDLNAAPYDPAHPDANALAVTSSKRPMMGQSDYVFNTTLSFDHPGWGSSVRLLFNTFGERISRVGGHGLPDTYEKPFNQLDAFFSQRLGQHWSCKLQAKNLLESEVRFEIGDAMEETYKKPREYSIGLSYSL